MSSWILPFSNGLSPQADFGSFRGHSRVVAAFLRYIQTKERVSDESGDTNAGCLGVRRNNRGSCAPTGRAIVFVRFAVLSSLKSTGLTILNLVHHYLANMKRVGCPFKTKRTAKTVAFVNGLKNTACAAAPSWMTCLPVKRTFLAQILLHYID